MHVLWDTLVASYIHCVQLTALQIITVSILRYKSYIQHKRDLRYQKTGGREIPSTRKSFKGKAALFAEQHLISSVEDVIHKGWVS